MELNSSVIHKFSVPEMDLGCLCGSLFIGWTKTVFFLHGAEPTGAVVVTAVGSMAAPVDWTGVPE